MDCAQNLSFAISRHQTGDIATAIRVYTELLSQDQQNAQILYLLGTACFQSGLNDEALKYLQESIQLNPNNPYAFNNIGVLLKDCHRLQESLDSFEKALRLKPNYSEAYYNQGLSFHALMRLNQALQSYNDAIATQADYLDAYVNRGNVLQDLGDYVAACSSYRQALQLNPHDAEIDYNLANALKKLRQFNAALYHYDQAIFKKTDYAEAYNNRGNLLRDQKKPEVALKDFNRAIDLKPDFAETYNNRGNVYKDLLQFDFALHDYEYALSLKHTDALNNRANLLIQRENYQDALSDYARLIDESPDYAEAKWNKGLLHLLLGDFSQGWELYEWRLKKADTAHSYPQYSLPRWSGTEDLSGKRILVYAEQGLGDVIQFCRYLFRLAELAESVIFEVYPSLRALMSSLNLPLNLVVKGDELPEFDFYCPLLSLPYAFDTRIDTIPHCIPYLFADPVKHRHWQKLLPAGKVSRMGVVWSGSPKNPNDEQRSIPVSCMAPLWALPLEWHCLHNEMRFEDQLLLDSYPVVKRHMTELQDLTDTAALIACLDLVITVDTCVAHLAGAMGKKVWILLPKVPDFRWMLDREDTPWYGSAVLFRQDQTGDWDGVIKRVAAKLVSLTALE